MSVVSLHTEALESIKHERIVQQVCERIAPNWPLDKLIAVNPFWGMKDRPFREVAANLSAIGNVQCLMDHQYWLSLYKEGQISDAALQFSLQHCKPDMTVEACVEAIQEPPVAPGSWKNLSELFDQYRSEQKLSWHDEIVYQTSQFLAAYYQQHAPIEKKTGETPADSLYLSWRNAMQQDKGISIIMGESGLTSCIRSLPDSLDALWETSREEMRLDAAKLDTYYHALLLDLNGWASYIAYRTWQTDSNELQGLLAIRLAWDLVIWRYMQNHDKSTADQVAVRWNFEQQHVGRKIQQHREYQEVLWVWWLAYEHTEQQRLQNQLISTPHQAVKEPEVHAVFCIDVRSEVIRRALEQQSPRIQTSGFAGFFGIPVAYQPKDTCVKRPQLPGLLSPAITAQEVDTKATRTEGSQLRAAWQNWGHTPVGSFSLVESAGWWYGFNMLKKMWFPSSKENPVSKLSHHAQWQLTEDGKPLSLETLTDLAQGALKVMAMNQFAPAVLLVGHCSHTTNNLHAAGLDCGACGGQSGEVNVRVLAQLLNQADVRAELAERGIKIPTNTRFIAGLHNTTTDEIQCFDDGVSERVKHWLLAAKHQAQKDRAKHFEPGLRFESDKKRNRLFTQRSQDWSQVQPEWGLANNGAFIVAPRSWTRNLNLDGRAFLHEYVWQQDKNFAVLEQLMTAPMIVTNWINMQYNASVSDNEKLGSGNKVLHNAVGGNIGVFEGNSGDLRIGLSKQSLHNGKRWMHQPQRLSVYLSAPKNAIDEVVAKHDMIKQLIDNDWLYLFCWERPAVIERLYHGQWYHSAGVSM